MRAWKAPSRTVPIRPFLIDTGWASLIGVRALDYRVAQPAPGLGFRSRHRYANSSRATSYCRVIPCSPRPDSFYNIPIVTASISRHF
jgi:hypothetical protein